MGMEAKLISTLTNAKTGTVVKKMLTGGGQLQKVIQYGEKTPLRQIGVDTVTITQYKDSAPVFQYFSQDGNHHLFSLEKVKEGYPSYISAFKYAEPLIGQSSFSKMLKNIFDTLRASKSMMG